MSSDRANFEKRIEEATKDYQHGEFSSIRATAKAYKLSHNTLGERIRGRKPRAIAHESEQHLTSYQEKALVDWILEREAKDGPPPTPMLEQWHPKFSGPMETKRS